MRKLCTFSRHEGEVSAQVYFRGVQCQETVVRSLAAVNHLLQESDSSMICQGKMLESDFHDLSHI